MDGRNVPTRDLRPCVLCENRMPVETWSLNIDQQMEDHTVGNRKSPGRIRSAQEVEDKKAVNKVYVIWSASIMLVAFLTSVLPGTQQISLAFDPLTELVPGIGAWASNTGNYAAASIVYVFMLFTLPLAFLKVYRILNFTKEDNVFLTLVIILSSGPH